MSAVIMGQGLREIRRYDLPVWMASDANVGPSAKLVWMILADLAFACTAVYPGVEEIGRRCGISPRSVTDQVKALVVAGWVEVEERPGTTSVYTVHVTDQKGPSANSAANLAANFADPRKSCVTTHAESAPPPTQSLRPSPFKESPLKEVREEGESAPPLDRPAVSGSRRQEAFMVLKTVGAAWAKVHPMGEDYALTDFDQKAVTRFAHRITAAKDLEGFLRRAAAACTKPTLERALDKFNDPEIVNGKTWVAPTADRPEYDALARIQKENAEILAEQLARAESRGESTERFSALISQIGRPMPRAGGAEENES